MSQRKPPVSSAIVTNMGFTVIADTFLRFDSDRGPNYTYDVEALTRISCMRHMVLPQSDYHVSERTCACNIRTQQSTVALWQL